jgi:hypothetical protein
VAVVILDDVPTAVTSIWSVGTVGVSMEGILISDSGRPIFEFFKICTKLAPPAAHERRRSIWTPACKEFFLYS